MFTDCLKPYAHIRGANYLPPSFVHFEMNDPLTRRVLLLCEDKPEKPPTCFME